MYSLRPGSRKSPRRFCGHCGASLIRPPPAEADSRRSAARGATRQPLVIAVAFGVLAVVALFIYFTRPGPCDSIFEQTAPNLAITLQHLKTKGGMVIGRDKVQDLAESSQRIGILCKTCCIAQQSGRINGAQFQDCLNTTRSYETKLVEVASNVDAANSARQQGQLQLVSEKTQQATLAASAAAGEAQSSIIASRRFRPAQPRALRRRQDRTPAYHQKPSLLQKMTEPGCGFMKMASTSTPMRTDFFRERTIGRLLKGESDRYSGVR